MITQLKLKAQYRGTKLFNITGKQRLDIVQNTRLDINGSKFGISMVQAVINQWFEVIDQKAKGHNMFDRFKVILIYLKP